MNDAQSQSRRTPDGPHVEAVPIWGYVLVGGALRVPALSLTQLFREHDGATPPTSAFGSPRGKPRMAPVDQLVDDTRSIVWPRTAIGGRPAVLPADLPPLRFCSPRQCHWHPA